MLKKNYVWAFLLLITVFNAHAYRIEPGKYYVGGGIGANVNVVRYDVAPRSSPKAELILIGNVDYAIDQNLGVFGTFMPQFGPGSIGFGFRAGAKYWFTFLDAPYIPYVSLALAPTVLFPMGQTPNHFNLGLSPGLGMNFFVMANFLVGAHVHFNPSIGFVDGEKKFEFSVMSFLDVTLKI